MFCLPSINDIRERIDKLKSTRDITVMYIS